MEFRRAREESEMWIRTIKCRHHLATLAMAIMLSAQGAARSDEWPEFTQTTKEIEQRGVIDSLQDPKQMAEARLRVLKNRRRQEQAERGSHSVMPAQLSIENTQSISNQSQTDDRGDHSSAPESSKPSIVRMAGSGSAETLISPQVPDRMLVIQYDEVLLADAMRLFSEQTGYNVICSAEAGKTEITAYLRDVAPLDALEAIVKANGLFYRKDDKSGIVRISTAGEYEKDLTSFREEQTRVFTLLYPNPVAVAQVIAQVFGDQVELNTADTDVDDLVDLSQRFNRFDLVDGRSLGLGTFESNDQADPRLGRTDNLSGGLQQLAGDPLGASLSNRSRRRPRPAKVRDQSLDYLSAAEIQDLENQMATAGDISEADRNRLMRRGDATIYVSTIRRNNQVVVRTGDPQSMVEIERLISQLDVPTPTVLLEVKVLRVSLADGINSAFEYFVGNDEVAGAFSDGNLAPAFPGANPASRILANGLGVSGSIPGALTFQVVDSNFQFRMQLLESENRVTALATPLILTANNEVSRIFVGDTLPFTVGFTPSQVVGGFNSVSGAVAATPITELRDVGQSLLITPNINADRTVTLRVVEENSERVLGGAQIPVPDVDGSGVTAVHVDTVRRRTVSGTVVARDGMAVALGGLIEEHVSDAKDQIPLIGSIPGLGILFRRQAANSTRSELVVVIRPYVFNTPSESAATTQSVLGELSTHPNSPNATGTLDTYLPCQPIRSDSECSERAKLFRFHNVKESH